MSKSGVFSSRWVCLIQGCSDKGGCVYVRGVLIKVGMSKSGVFSSRWVCLSQGCSDKGGCV